MKNILIGFLAATALVSMMAQVSQPGVPAGAVFHFTSGTCPGGYTELVAARGRTIYGLPGAGTNAGTFGTALTDLENRAAGVHGHNVTDPGHVHNMNTQSTFATTGGDAGPFFAAAGPLAGAIVSNTTGLTVNNSAGVAGTNAPGIQYITCSKS